jgi:hypothetical protein
MVIINLAILLCYGQQGYCSEQIQEQIVRNFYKWYFANDGEGKIPEHNDEIYNFVSKITVDSVRKQLCNNNINYFTKLGIYGYNKRIDVGRAIPVGKELFVVPVIFVRTNNEHVGAIVVLQKESGEFYITKIIDCYPF